MGQPAEGGIELTVSCFDIFFGFPFILVYFVQMSFVSEQRNFNFYTKTALFGSNQSEWLLGSVTDPDDWITVNVFHDKEKCHCLHIWDKAYTLEIYSVNRHCCSLVRDIKVKWYGHRWSLLTLTFFCDLTVHQVNFNTNVIFAQWLEKIIFPLLKHEKLTQRNLVYLMMCSILNLLTQGVG